MGGLTYITVLFSKFCRAIICPAIFSYFSAELLIANILNDERELENVVKNDFIHSTLPPNSIVERPVLQISPFFTKKDIGLARKLLAEIKAEKRRRQFREYLEYLMIPDLFFN